MIRIILFVIIPLTLLLLLLLSSADAMSISSKPMEEGSDLLNPWKSRWDESKLGWHKQDVHPSLTKYGHHIIPNFDDNQSSEQPQCSDPVRIFVPLCGKTVDMAFLASHPSISHVVGVDGIRQALLEFGQEQPSLNIQEIAKEEEEEEEEQDGYERFVGGNDKKNITLLKGDFFGLTPSVTGGLVNVVWDRASMVAIHPTMRQHYVEVMHQILQPGGTILLSTLERRTGTEQGKAAGPPFSISEAQVREYYESQDWVESVTLLEEVDEFAVSPDDGARFKAQGVTSFYELVFVIQLKS